MGCFSKQRGLSVFSLLGIAALVGLLAVIALRLIPAYTGYWSIVQIAKQVRSLPDLSSKTKAEIRKLINARFRMNGIRDHDPDVIKIERDKTKGIQLIIDYEDRRPMIANLDVVAKFNRTID